MESPVRIKSGAAVLLAFCVFLEVCNGFPNQNATAVKESKEQNSSEVETTLVFPNTTPRFLPRPSTWKFQRKVSNLTQYVTPVPSVVNVTLIRNDASDSIITTTPSGSKIYFRGSVRYFTTRLPFKPKIPHSRRNITKSSEEIDNDSAHTTEATRLASASDQSNKIAYNRRISFKLNLAAAESVANATTVLPEVLSVSSLTTQKSIETKKEKQNSVEPAKYTRRNNTRYREEVSEKPVIVTTEYPAVFKKSTTTRKSFEPKKDKQNIVESTRYNRRNFNRSRDEASEKSNINITRQPFVYRGKSTTINPIEDARERHNSIESTEDYRSVNRSEVGKSLDLGFNIDKYTSDDFHDINNVYSQSISPEIEHFIIPENVSDYFVNVNSGSFVPPADNYLASAMSLSTPHMDFFDKKFKEVSEGIKKNIAIAAAEYASEKSSEEQSTAESAETEVDNVNFDELLSLPPNNNTNIMFKNTKEITITDLKGPTNSYMDFTDSNGTNILFERETLSTESYDTSSVTVRTYPTENDSQNDEATTPTALESNRINIVSTIDNRVPKSDSTVNRRIDHFRTNNATRKEFLTTIRMKAYTTPKPRIRISLKSNRNFRNITAPTIKTEDATSTKAPEVVKMLPFTRRRNTLTTVASNIDPVLQESDSPTRVLDYSKSDRDNSIPALRKRGSPGKNSNTTSSNVTENDLSPQFTIPPTAWALITLRDTPNAKKSNATNSLEAAVPLPTDNIIKTENILQKLNKPLETHSQASNPQPVYEKYPAVSTSKKSNDEATSSSVGKINNHVTSPSDIVTPSKEGSNKSRDTIKTVQKEVIPDSDHSYSSYESITKLPHDFTTPLDDESPDSTSVNFMPIDYYGPTSIDESNDDNTENYTTETYPDTDESNPSLSMNHNVEATTMMHIPIPELFTFPTEDSDSDTSIVSTTEVVARKTTPLSTSTVATDDDVSTTETTTKITTATNEFGSFKPKQYTTTYNSFSRRTTNTPLDNDVNDLIQTTTHRIQDVGVKSVSESNAATSRSATYRITTTTDDDLDDFSFSTIPSSTVQDTTVESPKSTTGNALSSDATTTEIKNTSEDIVAASTMYYGTTKANNADMTTAYFSQTTHAVTTIKNDPLTESVAALTTTQKSADAREAKHKIVIDDEDKTTNSANSSDQNSDDWQDTSDPNSEIKTNDLLNNINITNTDDSSELDREIIGVDNDLPGYNRNESMSESATEPHNIEVIKMNMPDASDRETYVKETTTEAGGDTEKYDAGDGTGTVAAIAISVIGVIALLLLVIFLMVARGRRSGGGYGQRCTPVSLDSYSLDNVSVSGSTRRKARRPSKRSYGNPAYDESGATSHPMQFAALANFSLDQESIVSEFNDIPSITVRADEVPPGCESKNRFSNVIPLPETRVSLKPIPGDDTSDYINANYVRGPKNLKNYYIACQAPLASTVNDFWRMIWEQNSRVILMLTEFMENGVEKCFEYIPPSEVSDNRRVFGDYQVTVKKREIRDKYIISQLQVKSLGTHTWREVTHMWYFWPAKGVPDECNSIIAFLIEARSYLKASQNAKEYDEDGHDSLITHNGSLAPNQTQITIDPDEGNSSEMNIYNVQRGEKTKNGTAKNGTLSNKDGTMRGGPMVVHCSPGTGRTGAVLACDIGIRDFEMNRTVDVPKTVYRIRRDRANCVQTKDQYIFIYKVLSEYATKLTGGVLDSI